MKEIKPNQAVILMALGGLEKIDDVVPFLKRIMKGRPPTEKQIEEIRERYNLIGGKSPLNEITKTQAALLQKKFNLDGLNLKVFTAFLFTPPYIADTLQEISAMGIEKVTAFNIAPQRSERMICYYREEIDKVLADMKNPPNLSLISGYHNNEKYLKAVGVKIREKLKEIPKGKTLLLFSAHSLPVRPEDKTDIYEEQLRETVEGILKYTEETDYLFGYQSRGFSGGEWLTPSIDSIIENLSPGFQNILFVSVGFVSDNLEVLYDIDIHYRKAIEEQGFNFYRVDSLNNSELFIDALYDRLTEELR